MSTPAIRTALAQPEGEGPSDEELLRIAASAIDPYESCGNAVGEYEQEAGCAVEVYGSELTAYARAVLARFALAEAPEEMDLEANFRAWYEDVHGSPYFGAMPLCVAIKWAQHLLQQAAPQAPGVGEGPSERIISIAKAVQEHAFDWGPDARLIGNVCAEDVADLCSAILARWGHPTTQVVVPVAVSEQP